MLKHFYKYHFEWVALALGLLFMGLMNPYVDTGSSLCLFEALNFNFCPGEGLGHSIAFTFRGDLNEAIEAHPVGPFTILILSGRVLFLWNKAFQIINLKTKEK